MTSGTPRSQSPGPGREQALRLLDETLEEAGIYVAADLDGDTIVLSGEVDSQENRQAALDVAHAVADRLGLKVDDGLDVMDFSPEDALGGDDATGTVTDLRPLGDRPEVPEEMLDPDFTGDVGTTDVARATAEAEPYFPPTDPVVRPIEGPEELAVVGGFAATSMDPDESAVPFERRDDDEIAREVLRELREDAMTTDLPISVDARDGVVTLRGEVPSIDDVESTEEVAGRVAGVAEVREELVVSDLERDR